MDRLIKLAARFSDDPSVLQEVGKTFIQMTLLVSTSGSYSYIVIGSAASILNLKLCLINMCGIYQDWIQMTVTKGTTILRRWMMFLANSCGRSLILQILVKPVRLSYIQMDLHVGKTMSAIICL